MTLIRATPLLALSGSGESPSCCSWGGGCCGYVVGCARAAHTQKEPIATASDASCRRCRMGIRLTRAFVRALWGPNGKFMNLWRLADQKQGRRWLKSTTPIAMQQPAVARARLATQFTVGCVSVRRAGLPAAVRVDW